jgi:hypothetical protein
MANGFSKEERVAFEQLLAGFQDAEIMSKNVNVYNTDQQMMERAGDTVWRPVPYIMDSADGEDQTGNFGDKVQLSVPVSITVDKAVTWTMSGKELRDALQEGRLRKGAEQKLASDINRSVLDVASTQGSMVVKITAAASGFDDVAQIEAIMNEAGVMFDDRVLALSTRDYNGMASNLADRQTMGGKVSSAYERAYVGQIASFDTWKLDYSKRLAAAAGGAITIATNAAGTFYTPKSTEVNTVNGGKSNVDNRYQNVTVSATANVKAGDAFTIADVNAVHHITKEDTGQLKTFRVVKVVDGTTLQITPPLIDPSSGAGAGSEIQYQNCVVNTASATAAITWLNTASAAMNPFWYKDAIELIPGRYVDDADAGMAVLKGTTDSGIQVCMTKQFDIETRKYKFRVDVRYGVANKNPEMSGIILFNQV